jgi:hypothetical protein
MTKVQKFALAVLFAAIVASASAGAQSGSGASVGALSTGTALQGDPSAVAVPTKKTGNARSMVAGAPGAPRLCFQPGVGWQSVPLSTVGVAEQASGRGASGRTGTGQFALRCVAKSAYSRPSGGGQASDIVCSESFAIPQCLELS